MFHSLELKPITIHYFAGQNSPPMGHQIPLIAPLKYLSTLCPHWDSYLHCLSPTTDQFLLSLKSLSANLPEVAFQSFSKGLEYYFFKKKKIILDILTKIVAICSFKQSLPCIEYFNVSIKRNIDEKNVSR